MPKVIDALSVLPTNLKEKQQITQRKVEGLRRGVEQFIAWRPLDDARMATSNLQRSIEGKVEYVRSFGDGVIKFSKAVVDRDSYDIKKKFTSSPALQTSRTKSLGPLSMNVPTPAFIDSGKALWERILAADKDTLERLERERSWRIENGFEGASKSLHVGNT